MNTPYDCPECHQSHDEPAEATLAFRVLCLDCYLERAPEHTPRRGLLTKKYDRAA